MEDKLTTFRQGVHPPELKELTEHKRIRRMPFPDEVVLPLSQHTGKPATPVVKQGQRVAAGATIAEVAESDLGVNIHSSIDGKVTAVTEEWIEVSG